MSAAFNDSDYERGRRDGMAEAMAWKQRWTLNAIRNIRTVLECHALGAEVIALKSPKYERLAALHALEHLHKIEQVLRDAGLLDVSEPVLQE